MEHISGRTLRDLLDSQRRLSPETTAELLGPVADALDHAHHAGLVHRDVKPENLWPHPRDVVKVADFGLVRAAAQRGHGQALAATVHYCAPEVLRGGVVDGRADVYALGVVAWECVAAGRRSRATPARSSSSTSAAGCRRPRGSPARSPSRSTRPCSGPPIPTRPAVTCAPRTSRPPSAPPAAGGSTRLSALPPSCPPGPTPPPPGPPPPRPPRAVHRGRSQPGWGDRGRCHRGRSHRG